MQEEVTKSGDKSPHTTKLLPDRLLSKSSSDGKPRVDPLRYPVPSPPVH